MITTEEFSQYKTHKGYISPSDIKGVRTPLEFLSKLNAKRVHKDYFDFGSAFHALILEPHKFKSEVVCLKNSLFPKPENLNMDGSVSLTIKENKEFNLKFRSMNAGKIILNEADYNTLIKMKDAVMRLKGIKDLIDLENAYVENNFYARVVFDRSGRFERIEACGNDEKPTQFDVLIKTRPDFVHKERLYDLDVKTTMSVDPETFSADAAKLEYDIQAAMGLDIVSANTGKPYETFLFLAVEKSYPYNSILFDMDGQDIADARIVYIRRLNEIRKARNENRFKGFEIYSNNDFGMITLSLPQWYKNKQQNLKF